MLCNIYIYFVQFLNSISNCHQMLDCTDTITLYFIIITTYIICQEWTYIYINTRFGRDNCRFQNFYCAVCGVWADEGISIFIRLCGPKCSHTATLDFFVKMEYRFPLHEDEYAFRISIDWWRSSKKSRMFFRLETRNTLHN